MPRTYGLDGGSRYQLHAFCDASKEAFAAVIYVRTDREDPVQDTALVICKARLAPTQRVSIPRLELTAALIGARLMTFVKRHLPVPPTAEFFWTDSLVTLHWIRSDVKRWGVYVQNRVREIQQLTSPVSWNHCSGADNPADLPSRGTSASYLQKREWLHGPDWLSLPASAWPDALISEPEPAECQEEERAQKVAVHASTVQEESNPGVGQIMTPEAYSSLTRLHRVTAWVLRWAGNARGGTRVIGDLTADEIEEAERRWIGQVQRDEYHEEIDLLEESGELSANSRLFQLSAFIDSGILKLKGRVQESTLTMQEKHPILLPNRHPYVSLVILELHQGLCHAGVQQTLFALRERFWVPRARQRVRQVIHACLRCRIFRLQPYAQESAPLPRERVCKSPPFSCIGVDLGGPLYMKENGVSKTYFVLFVCAAVRAVHLELVRTLSTEDFLEAFDRFVARRGLPKVVFSDNATNFQGAAPRLANHGIIWKFNIPRAPWWGGFYERLVRTIKDALKRTLYKSLLTFRELETVVYRIESVINARPLTTLSEDPNDVRPISPKDFLRDTTSDAEVSSTLEIGLEHRTSLGARWRHRQQVLAHLWQRWHNEYIRELRDIRRETTSDPRIGDVVLIGDNPRSSPVLWNAGKITQLFNGRDGLPRSASVQLKDGTSVSRPIQRLYPLEPSS